MCNETARLVYQRVVPDASLARTKGIYPMNDDEVVAVDRVRRVLSLIEHGIDVEAVKVCIDRSSDDISLGMAIGVLEDLVELGFVRGSSE